MTADSIGTLNGNPYVFIVGCGRSGTTLVRRLLDAHPQLAVTDETHWIARWFEQRRDLTPDGNITPKLLPRLLESRKLGQFETGLDELDKLLGSSGPVSYSSFVTHIFELYGRTRGKRLVGNKTPSLVQDLPTLHALWPKAKFVHVIRDGRDVCLSVLNWNKALNTAGRFSTWAEDPLTTTALWWEWRVRLGHGTGRALAAELYYELRYESLVTRPVDESRALCDFLGLPYDEAMLTFHEGRTRTEPGLSAKKAWMPITAGLRDWRTQMSAENVERFEAAAGDLVDELGYPRTLPPPRSEALKHASKIREQFSRDLRSRGLRLPERWSDTWASVRIS